MEEKDNKLCEECDNFSMILGSDYGVCLIDAPENQLVCLKLPSDPCDYDTKECGE